MKKVPLNFTLYANMFQLKLIKDSKLKFPTSKNEKSFINVYFFKPLILIINISFRFNNNFHNSENVHFDNLCILFSELK
jgi:hypothetical protein